MKEFAYKEIESATGGFAPERVIGKGSHGCVYGGDLVGGQRIAVKAPLKGLDFNLDEEIELLGSIRGHRFVNALGFARSPANGGNLLVLEFMPNGSLHQLLHATAAPPPWRHRVLVALQIARAVQVLHGSAAPIIHRDIKPSNILFDGKWNARLGDFSLAVRWAGGAVTAPPAGTIGYLDPCYTGPGKVGPETDVFSLGVTLLELLSGKITSVVAWALPLIASERSSEIFDARLPPPRGRERAAVRGLLGVVTRCVSSEKARRPSMAEVVAELQSVVDRNFAPLWYLRLAFPTWRRRTKKIMCRGDEELDASHKDVD